MSDRVSFALVVLVFAIGLGGLMYYNGNIIFGEESPAQVEKPLPVKHFYTSQTLVGPAGRYYVRFTKINGEKFSAIDLDRVRQEWEGFNPGRFLYGCWASSADYYICTQLDTPGVKETW